MRLAAERKGCDVQRLRGGGAVELTGVSRFPFVCVGSGVCVCVCVCVVCVCVWHSKREPRGLVVPIDVCVCCVHGACAGTCVH